MRLLVTGGTGFIGSHLAEQGRRAGAEVVVLGLADRPEERAKVQGFNDIVIFGVVATTAFSSGWLQNAYGWEVVNWSLVPLILAVIAAALWIGTKQPASSAAE